MNHTSFVGHDSFNYTYVFNFEKKYFSYSYIEPRRKWMEKNWSLSILYAFIYVLVIFAGKHYMKNREKFSLYRSLIAWNFTLAAFSILGAVRSWPDFIYTIKNKGVEHSICSKDYAYGVTGCWAWLFILSKLPELFDTVFIVLRKQPLIFLHWYHHATVLVYCWYATRDFSSSGRWFIVMNYTIHGIMYTYYLFRAMRFKIPRWVNVFITSAQISQMVFGIYINLVAYFKKNRGEQCDVTYENINWSFFMYFTYFVLFVYYFYKAYLSKPVKTDKSNSVATTKKLD
jgi:elongation of very long chain fatty acids protein 6